LIDPSSFDFSDTPAGVSRPSSTYRPRHGGVEHPQVSIVTAFATPADAFHETARCVLGQSFQQWEWLVVNEAPTRPDALAALAPYRDLDPRIRIVDQPVRRGRGAARNAGCLTARAPYVYFLDEDDLIEPTTLEKCLWHLATHPEFAFTNAWSVHFGAEAALRARGYDEQETFLERNLAEGPFMVRRSAHAQVGGFDDTAGHGLDGWDYWLRQADRGLWGSTIPEYLQWRRRLAEEAGDDDRSTAFRQTLRTRYPRLHAGGFPRIRRHPLSTYEPVSADPLFANPLDKAAGVRRVLLLFPRLVIGGADKFVVDLTAQLAARRHEVTLCMTLDSDENPWLSRVTRMTPDVFRLATFLSLPDYPRFLLYLIDSRQIDVVVVSHSYLGYQLLPFLRAHRPAVACVDYSHIEAKDWNNGGYPRAAVGYQEVIDLNVVSSRHLKAWMVERGAQADRIEVVHTNVDTDLWKPSVELAAKVRAEFGFAAALPLILYAGRLIARKQPHVLGEVIRRLAEDGRLSFACLVAGDGEELPALRRFVADHRLDTQVRLLGWVSPERMRELLAAADIFFLPSKHEGLSMAIYEAMAMETVPVGGDVGGQAELVSPECGVLVPPGDGDVDRYVEALRRLIESAPLRAAMGAAARRRVVESFPLDQMGERMCEVLGRAEKLCLTEPRPVVGRGLGLESATLAIEYARLERTSYEVWRSHEDLAARVDDLRRQLSLARPAEHALPPRTTFAALCRRLIKGRKA
jgi:glycosyltransferase involved in cell wall biosynthesis